jgi:uncharacterized repeat protein (TIGR03803 family)
MNRKQRSRLTDCIFSLLVIVLFVSSASAEWKEKVLYSFQGGNDGATPAGGVVFDSAGNLYGTTADGGSSCPSPGCGTVFQLAPPVKKGDSWTENVLFVFNGENGTQPTGGLIIDSNGNLYGVTGYGGSGNCQLLGSNVGCGLVYELSPPAKKGGAWTYSILYSFQGSKDGQYPTGDLVFDSAGNLYGATIYGGGFGTCNAPYYLYCGTVFKLSPPTKGGKWKEKVLYSFKSGADGASPNGGLVLDSKGNLYGTTFYGGIETGECKYGVGGTGCGTAFQLISTMKKGFWTEKTLHRFEATMNEANPAAGMTFDGRGYLYGTTIGTVFQFAPPAKESGRWKETILYTFDQNAYGPRDALVFDQSGNLYGTTYVGAGGSLQGSAFELTPPKKKVNPWIFATIHGFLGPPDGEFPAASLTFDKDGNLFSTTQAGGTGNGCGHGGCGAIFEAKPASF